MKPITLLVSAIGLAACGSLTAHHAKLPPSDTSLAADIRAMDDRMTAAFNAHDADALMSLFSPDVEFYHDGQGLQDFKAVSAGFRGLFASGSDIRRQRLDPLEVYPVPGYGALEVGTHRFCHTEGSRQDCGAFEFVQVWKRDSTGWKITRVISYGH